MRSPASRVTNGSSMMQRFKKFRKSKTERQKQTADPGWVIGFDELPANPSRGGLFGVACFSLQLYIAHVTIGKHLTEAACHLFLVSLGRKHVNFEYTNVHDVHLADLSLKKTRSVT